MSVTGAGLGSGEAVTASGLPRPTEADEHRRLLLAQLPAHLAGLLVEPLGPSGLVGAAAERRGRDVSTAQLLHDFAQRRAEPLPEWDFTG